MKYLLDTNSLSKNILQNTGKRNDLYIIDEVLSEFVSSSSENQKIVNAGIKTVATKKIHLEKLKEVMAQFGSDFGLIRLYTTKGAADVLMLSYILGECAEVGGLFPEEWVLITQDKALISAATHYKIPTRGNL